MSADEFDHGERHAEESVNAPVPKTMETPDKPRSRRFWMWLWTLLAGNPFYPLSALLLLWGISCCSRESGFLSSELGALFFNFSALLLYEAVVVSVSVFLARRRLWYDAMLLVVLENGLMLVPLMLVMQALMITNALAAVFSVVAALLMVGRVILLKWGFPLLNLPAGLLALGALVLVVNLSLPMVYRPMIMEWLPDPREVMSRWIWYYALPLVPMLGFLLPHAGRWDGPEPQRNWIPLLLFNLWVIGTVVSVRSAEYVTNLPFPVYYLAPTAWIWGWLNFHRMRDLLPARWGRHSEVLAAVPMTGAALALGGGGEGVYLTLMFINAVVFGVLYVKRGSQGMLHAAILCAVALVAGMPESVAARLFHDPPRLAAVLFGVALWAMIHSMRRRTPAWMLCGALAACFATQRLAWSVGFHEVVQAGFLFYLMLSLAWRPGPTRVPPPQPWVAGLWAAHSIMVAMTDRPGDLFTPALTAGLLLAGVVLSRWLKGAWEPALTLSAIACVLLIWPMEQLIIWLRPFPPGLVPVLGSFVLLGIGTAFALTRHRWLTRFHPAQRDGGPP